MCIDLDLIESKDIDEFKCIIGRGLIEDPVSISCPNEIHVFCNLCISSWLKNSNKCPICFKDLLNKKLMKIRMIKNIVDKMIRYCDDKEKGCKWKGTFEEYFKHNLNCIYRIVNCSRRGCFYKTEFYNLKKHVFNCEYKHISCPSCNAIIQRKNLTSHLDNICPKISIKCEYCNLSYYRKYLAYHQDFYCAEKIYPCFFSKYGCDKTYKLENKDDHLEKFKDYHIEILHEYTCSLEDDYIKLENKIFTLEESRKYKKPTNLIIGNIYTIKVNQMKIFNYLNKKWSVRVAICNENDFLGLFIQPYEDNNYQNEIFTIKIDIYDKHLRCFQQKISLLSIEFQANTAFGFCFNFKTIEEFCNFSVYAINEEIKIRFNEFKLEL